MKGNQVSLWASGLSAFVTGSLLLLLLLLTPALHPLDRTHSSVIPIMVEHAEAIGKL